LSTHNAVSDARAKIAEIAVVALVSAGHFFSHFFVLAIPSGLPLIRAEFAASNVWLGAILASYALMSAAWQFPMGIFSDRYGARAFLIGGLAIESLAMFSQSLAPTIPVMIGLAIITGIADSVFHPADYTILTAKIRPAWLGRAYAVHTFCGFLGFAVAPIVMSLLLAHGGWRFALGAVGMAGIVMAGVLLVFSPLLAGVTYAARRPAGATPGLVKFLLSPPLLAMFLFYATATLSSNGLQSFGNSSLMALYDVDLLRANSGLAAYLWGTAAGVLGGGVIADRMNRLDAVAAVAYAIAAALLALIGLVWLPFGATTAALFFVGFMVGVVMPSRDLMVRTVTPPGSIGKAFGYVSSGFGVGGVFGPVIFGSLMDLKLPQVIFFVSAGMMIATIAVAMLASQAARRAENSLAAQSAG